MADKTIVIDNGGCKCRIGVAGERKPRLVFPNAVAKNKGDTRMHVGGEIVQCSSINQLLLKSPIDRGYLVNSRLQVGIWSKMLEAAGLEGHLMQDGFSHLVLTEPLFTLPAVQLATQEMVFEGLGFQSLRTVPAAVCCLHEWAANQESSAVAKSLSGVVLDAGYSATTAVPVFDGRVQLDAVKRIRIGGKLLTNLLKEWVSYRSMNLKEEPYLVELIKEQVSYVAISAKEELSRAFPSKHSHVSLQYVLPDGVTNLRGYVVDPRAPQPRGPNSTQEQATKYTSITVNNERFMVPEVLFNPSDIGLSQAGVCEAIAQATRSCHPALQPLLAQNVLLAGGTSSCPGFKARVESDLPPLMDSYWHVHVHQGDDPANMAWRGASLYASSAVNDVNLVTKPHYEEYGSAPRLDT